jgi:hypothetical protein
MERRPERNSPPVLPTVNRKERRPRFSAERRPRISAGSLQSSKIKFENVSEARVKEPGFNNNGGWQSPKRKSHHCCTQVKRIAAGDSRPPGKSPGSSLEDLPIITTFNRPCKSHLCGDQPLKCTLKYYQSNII